MEKGGREEVGGRGRVGSTGKNGRKMEGKGVQQFSRKKLGTSNFIKSNVILKSSNVQIQ